MKRFLATLTLAAAFCGVAKADDIPLRDWAVPRTSGIRSLADVTGPLPFIGIPPCRLVDTRGGAPITGGPYAAGASRTYLFTGQCGIPAGAGAVSMNVTVTNTTAPGYVQVYPAGSPVLVSTQNWSGAGQLIANAAIVALASGQLTFVSGGSAFDLIVDVNGYFSNAPAGGAGFYIYASTGGYAGYFQNNATSCSGTCGVYAGAASTSSGAIALTAAETGTAAANTGLYGQAGGFGGSYPPSSLTYAMGVHGTGNNATGTSAGVFGESSGNTSASTGVIGVATNSATGQGGEFYNTLASTNVYLAYSNHAVFTSADITGGTLSISGTKNFIAPHPEDPSKEIKYAAAESPTPDVFFRGTGHLVNGTARIDVPDHFRFSARAGTYMTTLTPVGDRGSMWVESEGPEGIVVRGTGDTFHYVIWAERDVIRDYHAVQENRDFTPEHLAKGDMLQKMMPAMRELLVKNGTLNPDGSFNEATARRLGWALPAPEAPAAPPAPAPVKP